MKSQFLRLESGNGEPNLSKKFLLRQAQITYFRTKYRTATHVYCPHRTCFFCFWIKLQTPCVIAPSLRSRTHKFDRAHRCCPCAREKRRPWSRWLVSRKSEGGCARDGHFFRGWSIFEPKDRGLSQAVVERSEAVRQRSKKVTSSSRRSSPQP